MIGGVVSERVRFLHDGYGAGPRVVDHATPRARGDLPGALVNTHGSEVGASLWSEMEQNMILLRSLNQVL